MAKLHELLAAESSVAAAHNTITEETLKTFGKPDHFMKVTTNVGYFDEKDQHLDTEETKDIVTTVDERLKYSFGRPFVNYIDLLVQKDRTNQEARADVIVNGVTLLKGIPATALLTLETKVGEKRGELMAIPTLQPGVEWEHDASQGLHKAKGVAPTFRSQKTIRPIILHPATTEHPAQVEKVMEDKQVARIERTTWSGMWTSKQKHDALARLDALLVAIKKARQRANRQPIVKVNIGESIAGFILSGPSSDALTGTDTDESEAA